MIEPRPAHRSLLALAAALPGVVAGPACSCGPAHYPPSVQLAVARRSSWLAWLGVAQPRARARRAAAPDRLESARGAARGRLLDPGARRRGGDRRRSARSCSRSTRWPRRCATSGSARSRRRRSCSGHGRDRRRRSSPSTARAAPGARQPLRRAAARAAPRPTSARQRRRELGPRARCCAGARTCTTSTFPGRRGPLGDPANDASGRAARRTTRSCSSDVSQPLRDEERAGLAAADPRHRPRAEQLAGADQVDRRQPGALLGRDPPPADWRDDMRRGLHVIASRAGRAQPVHERLRAARAASAAAPRARRRRQRWCAVSSRSRPRLPVALVDGPAVTVDADSGSARAAADQSRCATPRTRRSRRTAASAPGGRCGRCRGGDSGRRRGAGPAEHGQPLRAVLHDQAGRVGHRAGARPPDRRGARRHADAARPRRCSGDARHGPHPALRTRVRTCPSRGCRRWAPRLFFIRGPDGGGHLSRRMRSHESLAESTLLDRLGEQPYLS